MGSVYSTLNLSWREIEGGGLRWAGCLDVNLIGWKYQHLGPKAQRDTTVLAPLGQDQYTDGCGP